MKKISTSTVGFLLCFLAIVLGKALQTNLFLSTQKHENEKLVGRYDETASMSLVGSKAKSDLNKLAYATPEVYFNQRSLTAIEQPKETSTETICRKYVDYRINISISEAPASEVNVTIKIDSSTARRLGDYQITTGPSFSDPSNTVTFTKETLTRIVFLRIFDDNEVEPTEYLKLGFTIADPATAMPRQGFQNIFIEIQDDDKRPFNSASGITGAATTRGILFVQDFPSIKTQILYRASELNAAGVYKGLINSIAFNVLDTNTKEPFTNLTIRMGKNNANFLKTSSGVSSTDSLRVYYSTNTFVTSLGWNNFRFANPFYWDGVSNVVVEICYNYNFYPPGPGSDWVASYADTGSNGERNFIFQGYVSCGDTSLSSYPGYINKPQARFSANNIAESTDVSDTIGQNETQIPYPFWAEHPSIRNQISYRKAELNNAGIYRGLIRSLAFNVVEKNTRRTFENFSIKLGKNNSNFLYSDGVMANSDSIRPVYSIPRYNTTLGWNHFEFDTAFYWDGVSNITVDICYSNPITAAADTFDLVAAYVDGANDRYNNLLQPDAGCDATLATARRDKPQIILYATNLPTTVATEITQSPQQYLSAANDLYYYSSTTNNVIGRIRNKSEYDYGCTVLGIDTIVQRPQAICLNNRSAITFGKVFHVQPTKNNTSGEYDISFFFTREEVRKWEEATGQSWQNVRITKSPDKLGSFIGTCRGLSGVGNPELKDGEVKDPIHEEQNDGQIVSLRTSFPTGFSYFFLTAYTDALPTSLVDFNGKLNNQHGELAWKTSSEINSKHFVVERSYDGVTFKAIGLVKAAGSSSAERNYSFVDSDVAQDNNYYRLRMVDNDNSEKLSKVILLVNNITGQQITIGNNPFKNFINIRFNNVPIGKVQMRLTDVSGKTIESRVLENAQTSTYRFSLQNTSLSRGIYLLTVESEAGRQTFKVVKE